MTNKPKQITVTVLDDTAVAIINGLQRRLGSAVTCRDARNGDDVAALAEVDLLVTQSIFPLPAKLPPGVALDVFETEPLPPDHPLRDAPNVLISPHCSPESEFFREEMINLIAQNVGRFIAGQLMLNVVC